MRVTLVALAALFVAVDVVSAAIPSDKYAPDDTDAVIVINVKQILASKLFTENLKKLVEDALSKKPVASILKESNFNPLTDVDRVMVFWPRSGFSVEKVPDAEGPNFLFEGRFDPKKIDALFKMITKDAFSHEKYGDAKIYQLPGPTPMGVFGVVLGNHQVFAALRIAHTKAALDKAAGKATTALKNKAFAERFAKLPEGDTLVATATRETVIFKEFKGDADKRIDTKLVTLADLGVESLVASVRVDTDVSFRVELIASDKDKAAKMAKDIREGVKKIAAEVPKDLSRLADVLEALQFEVKEAKLTLEGKVDSAAVKQLMEAASMPRR
jgi:hypothetical protein